MHYKNPPTPCLWQAPASTQKTKRKTRPAIRRSARWGVNNFRYALFTWAKTRGCLQSNHTKPPPAGFGGAVRRSRAITKKNMPFVRFFHVQPKPKHQNDAIFVNTEGFRPCLSKPSYRAPKWALTVRLMQKERLKSPQKSLIIENQAFWVILAILAKTAILVILVSHFRARVDTPTKSPTWGLA